MEQLCNVVSICVEDGVIYDGLFELHRGVHFYVQSSVCYRTWCVRKTVTLILNYETFGAYVEATKRGSSE